MDINKIKQIIKGDVESDAKTLSDFSRDASIYRLRPQVVVFPKDVDDIKALVKYVSEQKEAGQDISLTARSAGTDMTGGPLSESIVLSMTRYFNHIKKIGKDFAVVEPGVYYRDFEKETLKQHLLLPSYPASRELCTVGGMAANNSGGELNLLYGKTENYVQELKMVLRDGREYTFVPLNHAHLQAKMSQGDVEGEVYLKLYDLIDKNYHEIKAAKPNVSKNSAGYYLWNVYDRQSGTFDITKVIVGSQGTFGIITEIKFGLVRPKAREHLLVVFLDSLHDLAPITNHLLQFKPQSIESYDDHTFKVAIKLLPDILSRLRGNAIKLAFSFLPELWMTITGGVPKLVLLAEFSSDDDADAITRAKEAQESLREFSAKGGSAFGGHLRTKLVLAESDAQKYWVIRRESFNMLRHHVRGMRTAPFIDDFVVRPEVLGEFLPKLYQILDKYKLLYTIAGHVGDGNFHIIPLMKVGDPKASEVIKNLGEEVYDLVLEYKGSITGEHNDGLVRGPYLGKMYGPAVEELFLETKKIFDPDDIFNPGKKAEASLEFGLKHLDFS
ncbi:MAG TPA: FAD-binding oxidoreductase [Patescibacteria group bacterium]|nr:FAD-binding oxidoreductase [Patescibacteria group bacterium]